jgi:mercuric ion binding protein
MNSKLNKIYKLIGAAFVAVLFAISPVNAKVANTDLNKNQSVELTSESESQKNKAQVTVKGMVCAFCAQGIRKKFESEKSVKKIEVSLESYQVSLEFHPGQALKDEKITELLKDAGYGVDKIEWI